jgi:hypothetical protein
VVVTAGLGVFVAVYAVATVRAAPLTVFAGRSAVPQSCSHAAAIAYVTAFSPRVPGYVVDGVRLTSPAACANHHFELTIQDRFNRRAQARGMLDENGVAVAVVANSRVDAASVSVSLVITDGLVSR